MTPNINVPQRFSVAAATMFAASPQKSHECLRPKIPDVLARSQKFKTFMSFRSHLGTPALKTRNFSKKSAVLVKRKNGFTKNIPWTENPVKIWRRAF